MKDPIDKQIRAQLDAISERLTSLEEHIVWLIRPDTRFQIGQRVEWSRRGRAHGFPRRKVAQRGIVKAIEGFSIVVNLDGLKKPTSYHHAFFNPLNGPKLF